jgi:hypothetical protein
VNDEVGRRSCRSKSRAKTSVQRLQRHVSTRSHAADSIPTPITPPPHGARSQPSLAPLHPLAPARTRIASSQQSTARPPRTPRWGERQRDRTHPPALTTTTTAPASRLAASAPPQHLAAPPSIASTHRCSLHVFEATASSPRVCPVACCSAIRPPQATLTQKVCPCCFMCHGT